MVYRFRDCEIDGDARELRVRGTPVDVEPRAFDLLLYLLQRRDRVVSKDELLSAIWPRQIVTEAALARCVMKARRAIGDDSVAQDIIRTLHGHGYRFVAEARDGRPAPARGAGFMAPAETHYARTGELSIAYQVIGSGPVDIVLVNGWISNVELAWEHPRPRGFLERLASFSRLINFDKRGTGLSDRGGAMPTFEERMDDVRTVMDAAGSERAVLMGYSEGGPMCALFAATCPERTLGIVLYGTYMKRIRSLDYPWAPTREERLRTIESAEVNWDQGFDVEHYAPSQVGDTEFANWLMAYWRRSASPGTAAEILRMNTDIDMCHVLPSIHVPTLVLHRTFDRDSKVDEGRYIAKHIPGAKFIELPGADHLPWAGNIEDILGPVETFVAGLDTAAPVDTVLVTLVEVLPGAASGKRIDDELRHAFEALVYAGRGQIVNVRAKVGANAGAGADVGLLASFDGTGRAIRCALALLDEWREKDGDIRVGLHVGECQRSGDAITGPPVSAVRAVAGAAASGGIAASAVVRDLVTGFRFVATRGTAPDGRTMAVYAVEPAGP